MEHKLIFKDYNEALQQNRLLGLKCRACGAVTVPPKIACRQCSGSEMDIVELRGNGKIRTFTTVNVASEGLEDRVPYIVVMVELDEGPWLMGNLDGADPQDASMELIGKRVAMGNELFGGDKYSAGESARPVFKLAD